MEQEKNQTKKMLKQTINQFHDGIHTLEDIPDNKTVYLEYENSSTCVCVTRYDDEQVLITIYNAKNKVNIKINKDDLQKIKLGVY